MRRIAVVFGSLIGAGAIVLVVLLMRAAGKDKGPPPPPPLSCKTLQQRAKTCQSELAGVVGEEVQAYLEREGYSVLEQAGARLLVGGYFRRAVDDQKVAEYCRQVRVDKRPVVQGLWRQVETCWPRRSCADFSACLRRLAKQVDAIRGLLD